MNGQLLSHSPMCCGSSIWQTSYWNQKPSEVPGRNREILGKTWGNLLRRSLSLQKAKEGRGDIFTYYIIGHLRNRGRMARLQGTYDGGQKEWVYSFCAFLFLTIGHKEKKRMRSPTKAWLCLLLKTLLPPYSGRWTSHNICAGVGHVWQNSQRSYLAKHFG